MSKSESFMISLLVRSPSLTLFLSLAGLCSLLLLALRHSESVREDTLRYFVFCTLRIAIDSSRKYKDQHRRKDSLKRRTNREKLMKLIHNTTWRQLQLNLLQDLIKFSRP